MSIFSKFKKFLTKHSDELSDLVSVLSIVIPALPIDHQDKRRAREILDKLGKASDSISKSVDKMTEADEVPIKEETIIDAVASKLPDIVAKLVKKK